MIIVEVKPGDNIEKALKKFKRKFEKTVRIRNDHICVNDVIFSSIVGSIIYILFFSRNYVKFF